MTRYSGIAAAVFHYVHVALIILIAAVAMYSQSMSSMLISSSKTS